LSSEPWSFPVVGVARDADARLHRKLDAVDVERPMQGIQDALGDEHGRGLAVDVRQQHHELVATDASDRVHGP
jgi:hypothetical protein